MSSASDPNVTISFTGEASSAVRTTDALTSALSRLVDAGHRATNGISGLNSALGRTTHQTRIVGNLGAEYAKVGAALQNVSRSTAQSVAGFNALATAAQRAGAGMGAGVAGGQRGAAAAAEKSGGGGLTALLGGAGGMKGMLASTAAFTGVSVSMAMAGNEARKLITENMNLDKAMSAVAAVGNLDKQGPVYQKLTAMVREYGKSTQYSAVQAATGLKELIAAGYDAANATSMLGDVLNLAAADNLEMGRASEILVSIMQSMQLGVGESTRVANVLARAANASTASIDDLGESMKYAAPVAFALGISLEDTAAAMALLANSGVKGGLSGRGFGAMMVRMVAPAEDVAKKLDRMGVSLSAINPEVVGMVEAFKALDGASVGTLAKLFGAENLDVASIMIKNAKAFGDVRGAVNDASVTVEEMAKKAASHLETGFKRIKGALSEIYLSVGKEPYDKLVQGTLDFAKSINEHSAEIITFGTRVINLTQNLIALGAAFRDAIPHVPMDWWVKQGNEFLEFADAAAQWVVTGSARAPESKKPAFRKEEDKSAKNLALAKAQENDDKRKLSEKIRADEAEAAADLRAEQAEEAGTKALQRRTDAEVAADKARIDSMPTRQRLLALNEQERMLNATIAQAKRKDYEGMEYANAVNAQADLVAVAAERKKLMDESLETQREMKVALRSLEADEARAAGNTAKADALEEQNRLLELQIGYMKQLHVDEETAGEMAARKMAAEKKLKGMGKERLVIADSLQSVGGGGRVYIGGDVADLQLRAQQDIARNTERTANALTGGGFSATRTGGGGTTQTKLLDVMARSLDELRKITTNTAKTNGPITVRRI